MRCLVHQNHPLVITLNIYNEFDLSNLEKQTIRVRVSSLKQFKIKKTKDT